MSPTPSPTPSFDRAAMLRRFDVVEPLAEARPTEVDRRLERAADQPPPIGETLARLRAAVVERRPQPGGVKPRRAPGRLAFPRFD